MLTLSSTCIKKKDMPLAAAQELTNDITIWGTMVHTMVYDIQHPNKINYDDAATDSESYLYEDGIEAESFTLGAVDAEKFLDEVSSWIPNIRSNFVANLENVYTPGMDPADIKVDTTVSYPTVKTGGLQKP